MVLLENSGLHPRNSAIVFAGSGSSGDRSVIGDRESLTAAVERVKAHSDLRPDRINRREINRRLRQYARGDREWLFCDRIG